MDPAATDLEGGAAVPGLGLVRWVAEWGWGKQQDHSDRRERLESNSAISSDHADIADRMVEMLTWLSRPGLPTVLFVEDLHDADPLLLEVLRRLADGGSAILLVTTGWPGHLHDARPGQPPS